jgi:cytochrome P450
LLTGTDNPANTAEWALSHLLNNPGVYKKAIAEIDTQVGTNRLIRESDLASLPYLNCIVNEVLRLNPGSPLLVPHEAREEVLLGGYAIPRGTMLLVNAYQIHRDPKSWEDPMNFMPERFERRKEGNWMIPFGMGMRKCPGEELARHEVGIIIGSLIQCFDWERIDDELIDLREGSGLTLPKAVPVEALYRPRQVMLKTLCEF